MNVVSLFFSAAQKHPDRLAIIEKKNQISYQSLKTEVNETAAYFKNKGISKGDRVLIFVPMSIDLYRIVLALFQIGAVAVFLDEWVSKKRMEICCEIADCKGFIGTFKANTLRLFSSQLRNIPVRLKVNGKAEPISAVQRISTSDSALITFTTGSTGRPKAADRTHDFLYKQFNALLQEINPHIDDIDMPALPIVLFINLGVGCTSVIADFKASKPSKMNPAAIFKQLKLHKVSRITASPYFIEKLARYAVKENKHFDGLKKVFTGGAPVFQREASLFCSAFPSAEVNIVYGSTEAEPISSVSAKVLANSSFSENGLYVGEVFNDIEVRIIKISEEPIVCHNIADFESLLMKEGEIGEIVVSGDHVLKSYYNSEAALLQNKIKVEETTWHRTGDSGFVQANRLFLTGRCKQLIVTPDVVLSPFTIENELKNIDGVTAGTLVKTNKGMLILVLESSLSLSVLERKLSTVSFPYDEIKILNKLPRDPRHNTKVDYDKLIKLLTRRP